MFKWLRYTFATWQCAAVEPNGQRCDNMTRRHVRLDGGYFLPCCTDHWKRF